MYSHLFEEANGPSIHVLHWSVTSSRLNVVCQRTQQGQSWANADTYKLKEPYCLASSTDLMRPASRFSGLSTKCRTARSGACSTNAPASWSPASTRRVSATSSWTTSTSSSRSTSRIWSLSSALPRECGSDIRLRSSDLLLSFLLTLLLTVPPVY